MTRVWPAQRTLDCLRKRGIRTQKVERWQVIPNAGPGMPPGKRIDLFGFIDGIALIVPVMPNDPRAGIIGWQACARSSMSDHIAKITGECRDAAYDWLLAGGRIQVWGWGKMKRQPRDLWLPLVVELCLEAKRTGNGDTIKIVECYRGDPNLDPVRPMGPLEHNLGMPPS